MNVEITTNRVSLPNSLPVSTVKPVGRRYYWRVRACDTGGACSPWSKPRYLDVGRERKDLNGDGYADLVVAAPAQDSDDEPNYPGAVAVFEGRAEGFSTLPTIWLIGPYLTAFPHLQEFGASLDVVGDLNADGYSDLVVGASQTVESIVTEIGQGRIYVYYGGPNGNLASRVEISGPDGQAGAFGSSVAGVGDTNGDGYADFAVGAYWFDSGAENEGNVFVFRGRSDTVSTTPSRILDSPNGLAGDCFGHRIFGGGDVNGDGLADMVVTNSPRGDSSASASVYFGSRSGVASTPSTRVDGPNQGSYVSVSLGDIDGNGHSAWCWERPATKKTA